MLDGPCKCENKTITKGDDRFSINGTMMQTVEMAMEEVNG